MSSDARSELRRLRAGLDLSGEVDTEIRAGDGSEVIHGKAATRLRRTFSPQFKKDAVRL